LTLTVLDKEYSIHRLNPEALIPEDVFGSGFYFIGKTDEELSIVCECDIFIDSEEVDTGWSCLKVSGPLDLGLTGVLAGISAVLAKAGISIFALSTYKTDFILTKTNGLSNGITALEAAGYSVK
jgi:hypothetical protein